MISGDTIAAISSAAGRAPRIIVRASGPAVRSIHQQLIGSSLFTGGSATREPIRFNSLSIQAWIYRFAAPASITGEDLIELHLPGNPLLADLLLRELIRLGARQAEAGEFSARAYLGGKIGLSEAEGIAMAISAQHDRELLAARQLMSGELARRLREPLESLAATLALIEAGIDFIDQEISLISADQVRDRLTSIQAILEKLLAETGRFERLSHEPRIVLAGRPNAGKSTLLNALCGGTRTIVSDQPGTTRDAIWAEVELPHGKVRVIDVAGFEEIDESDAIARSMRDQALRAIESADILLLLRDSTDRRPDPDLPRKPDLYLFTKRDLEQHDGMSISARTGAGMGELRTCLDEIAFSQSSVGENLALNARHVELIQKAIESISRADYLLPDGGDDLLALELRDALDHLGGVIGQVTPDDLLGRIFSTFCIGK